MSILVVILYAIFNFIVYFYSKEKAKLKFIFFILKRFILSGRNSNFISLISIFTISGIALGVTVLIISLSVITGFEKVISKKIVDFNSHIIISGFGNNKFDDNPNIENRIKTLIGNDFLQMNKFISHPAIIYFKNQTEGIELTAFNSAEPNQFPILNFIMEGQKKYPHENEIILGKILAEKYGINIGDKVAIFYSEKINRMNDLANVQIKQFIVSAIYQSDFAQYDDLKAFIDFNSAQKFFNFSSQISGYNIKLRKINQIEKITNNLQSNLNYPYYARNIFQQYQNIFTWINLQKKPIPIVLGLITLVAAFNIIGTILMIILEKTSQIGILSSIGTKKSVLIKIFMIEGLALALVGIIFGNILALMLIQLQVNFNIINLPGEIYFLSRVPLQINPILFLIVNLVTISFSVLTSFIPAYLVSKINIVKAIRFE